MLSEECVSISDGENLTGKDTDIAMSSEVLQKLDLTQSPLRKDLLAEDIGHFLNGDPVTSQIIGGSTGFPLISQL